MRGVGVAILLLLVEYVLARLYGRMLGLVIRRLLGALIGFLP